MESSPVSGSTRVVPVPVAPATSDERHPRRLGSDEQVVRPGGAGPGDAGPGGGPREVVVDRRAFLGAAALVAAGAAAAGGGAVLLGRSASRTRAREAVRLPAPADPAPPLPAGVGPGLPDLEPRLLPRRHRPDRAACRPRLLAAEHRWAGGRAREAVVRRPARPPARRARRHAELRIQRGRRPLHRHRPLAGRPAGAAAARGRGAAGRGPTARPVDRGHDDRDPGRGASRWARAVAVRRHERRAAPLGHGFPVRMLTPGLYGYAAPASGSASWS